MTTLRVQRQFGATADDYATSDIHAHGESLTILSRLLGLQPDWSVLDVATGAGHTALMMAPFVERVSVVDLTPAMLAKALQLAADRGYADVQAVLAGGERLPWPDSHLDAVTCRLALHHFSDIRQAMADWFRVLRPGGQLGLTDNVIANDIEVATEYNAFEILRDPSHHWVGPLACLEATLREVGFEVLESVELTKEFEFHEWADRQRVPPADKSRLMEMLRRASPGLRDWLRPRWEEQTAHFHLREVVILARKPLNPNVAPHGSGDQTTPRKGV